MTGWWNTKQPPTHTNTHTYMTAAGSLHRSPFLPSFTSHFISNTYNLCLYLRRQTDTAPSLRLPVARTQTHTNTLVPPCPQWFSSLGLSHNVMSSNWPHPTGQTGLHTRPHLTCTRFLKLSLRVDKRNFYVSNVSVSFQAPLSLSRCVF